MLTNFSTGSLGLDILLGGYGWERGYIHEIWGEPGSGKTTLAQHAVYEIGGGELAVWVVAGSEIPQRPMRAAIARADNAEHAFGIVSTSVIGGASLVVVDSANGLIRKRELDGDPTYTPHPQREYRQELNELKAECKAFNSTVIFLSKPRDRDRQPIRGTGISEKARTRVQLVVSHEYQNGDKQVKAWVKDDNTGFLVKPGTGLDWCRELTSLAIRYNVVESSGSWFTYQNFRWHGIEAFRAEIENNARLAVDLETLIRHEAMKAAS